MRALPHQDDRGQPATLDYRSVTADRGDWREHSAGALRNLGLLLGMLACVTAFLFLALAGLGMMVMAVTSVEWIGLGVCCVMLGMGALFLAGWCLDAMR